MLLHQGMELTKNESLKHNYNNKCNNILNIIINYDLFLSLTCLVASRMPENLPLFFLSGT